MISKLNFVMDFCYLVGIDIAKDTLDWAVYTQQHGIRLSIHTGNTLKGIKEALTQLKVLPGWNSAQAVFCMEHTGIYNAHLLELLYESKLSIWLESSLQIKQAGGMQRGKTARRPGDKVDAQRIAQYARTGGPVSLPRSDPTLDTTSRGDAEIGLSKRDSSTTQSGLQPTGSSSGRAGNVHQ